MFFNVSTSLSLSTSSSLEIFQFTTLLFNFTKSNNLFFIFSILFFLFLLNSQINLTSFFAVSIPDSEMIKHYLFLLSSSPPFFLYLFSIYTLNEKIRIKFLPHSWFIELQEQQSTPLLLFWRPNDEQRTGYRTFRVHRTNQTECDFQTNATIYHRINERQARAVRRRTKRGGVRVWPWVEENASAKQSLVETVDWYTQNVRTTQ